MSTTGHSDHLTGPQPVTPVLPITELFAAGLLPPWVPQSRSLVRITQHRLGELAAGSQLTHVTDQARAFLAASAMGNVVTLSALVESCYQTAFVGAAYYHATLRAYGVETAQGIAQFRANDDRPRRPSATERPRTPPKRIHSTMNQIVNGLASVGCLTPIVIVLPAWTVWHDDTLPTTTTRVRTDI